jgi:hypothetical protein
MKPKKKGKKIETEFYDDTENKQNEKRQKKREIDQINKNISR